MDAVGTLNLVLIAFAFLCGAVLSRNQTDSNSYSAVETETRRSSSYPNFGQLEWWGLPEADSWQLADGVRSLADSYRTKNLSSVPLLWSPFRSRSKSIKKKETSGKATAPPPPPPRSSETPLSSSSPTLSNTSVAATAGDSRSGGLLTSIFAALTAIFCRRRQSKRRQDGGDVRQEAGGAQPR